MNIAKPAIPLNERAVSPGSGGGGGSGASIKLTPMKAVSSRVKEVENSGAASESQMSSRRRKIIKVAPFEFEETKKKVRVVSKDEVIAVIFRPVAAEKRKAPAASSRRTVAAPQVDSEEEEDDVAATAVAAWPPKSFSAITSM